ncbi:uncharacterized protein [Nicotiana tomentosiformis]|uniref:uncharacterized protein n=1 Tax=Nicotiana tomentosiformis TaxID=4098 RepID=UPI00388C9855
MTRNDIELPNPVSMGHDVSDEPDYDVSDKWISKRPVGPVIKALNVFVAQVSDVVPDLKEWVEGLVSQKPYSERAWMELSKGRWEVRNHGLPKDVAMMPPSGEEDVPLKSPAPKQGDEKKRKRVPNSPNSKKKKLKKRSRKPKGSTDTLSSDSIRRLRDESKEEEEEEKSQLVARVRASVLHHETFLRCREELTHHEAEVRDLTEKSDTYKLLSEKLRADLVTVRNEHAEMAEQVFRVLHDSEDELKIVTNDLILEVRQRLEQIREIQAQVDTIQAEAEEFKKNMDILASKREVAQAQLESIETQLRAAKEKASVQVKKIEELQSQLDLAISDKANLANELEAAKSEVSMANIKADAKVSQFKVDVEAIQAQAKSMVDHARWKAREALEGVHAQDFDILAEIENAKAEEARARKLAFYEEDSESLSESEGGEDPEGEDATSDEDQAT